MLNIPDNVKNMLKTDGTSKLFTVHFPNGERADITERNVTADSVQFTESLCSQRYLKFGLTESSAIEFETIGIENIADMEIECSYEVIVGGIMQSIPLGRFVVESCPRNHEAMTRRKVTAYTKSMTGLTDTSSYEFFKRRQPNIFTDKMTVYMDEFISAITGIVDYAEQGAADAAEHTYVRTEHGEFTPYRDDQLGRHYFYIKDRFGGYTEAIVIASCTTSTQSKRMYPTRNESDAALRQRYLYQFDTAPSYMIQQVKDGLAAALDRYIEALAAGGQYEPALYRSNGTGKGYTAYGSGAAAAATVGRSWGYVAVSQYYRGVYGDTGSGYYGETYVTHSGEVVYPDDDGSGKKVKNTTYSEEKYYQAVYYLRPQILKYVKSGNVKYIDENESMSIAAMAFEIEGVSDQKVIYKCNDYVSVMQEGASWSIYRNQALPDDEMKCVFPATGTGTVDLADIKTSTHYDVEGSTFVDIFDATDMLNGYLELHALFGNQQRDGSYALIPLSKANPIRVTPSEYRSMWWDEYDIAPIGSVKYKYTGEQVAVYRFGDGLSTYDMTDNYLLKNLQGATQSVINALLDEFFVPNIQDIAFTPVELTMRGLPYLEDGDYLEVETPDGTVVGTYIMQHTISGIQSLTDDIESQGGEIIGEE